MKNLVASLVVIAIYAICSFAFKIGYERDVGGYLKQAADANNTEMAERKLQQAVDGMQHRGLCNGGGDNCFTSVLYRVPEDDVGYWRANIEATLEDLKSMSEQERADNLVESNQLIKVRETLIDGGKSGDKVTQPPGIYLYPHNGLFFVFGFLAFGYAIVAFIRFFMIF